MKRILYLLIAFVLFRINVHGQINFTANDAGAVPTYSSPFYYGTNMGYYPPWNNQTIADIAAGNTTLNVKGAGVKTLHLPLPEDFLETWGYDVSINDFIHYNSIGIRDNTVFLENPAPSHIDNTSYGSCGSSLIWSNLYTPIWDGGANGTPVNDNNYLALYIYKTVTRYKQWVKVWELVNEPDFDAGSIGWRSPGDPAGSWWDRNPTPCELLNLKAPLVNYVRMMRIAYEVVKYVDPTAYVAMGGASYPSFIDAFCRNTDNPVDGSVTGSYPVKGGAYFDCLSFHDYPMYDLSNNRHSDAAIDVFLKRKSLLDSVLQAKGYNGTVYPKKPFINTENNVPRKSIGGLIGGDDVQRNYVMKALIESQLHDIKQFYVFSIGDSRDYASATNPFDVVGLYQPLNGVNPYNQQYNNVGIAYKTMSDVLSGFTADTARTTQMSLPANIRGGAFKNAGGDYIYALWAVTTTDNSEAASATYAFPTSIIVPPQVNQLSWNFSQTNSSPLASSQFIGLTAAPSLILSPLIVTALRPDTIRSSPRLFFALSAYPNPVREKLNLKLELQHREDVAIMISGYAGQPVVNLAAKSYSAGVSTIAIPLPSALSPGIYYCRLVSGIHDQTIKFVVGR